VGFRRRLVLAGLAALLLASLVLATLVGNIPLDWGQAMLAIVQSFPGLSGVGGPVEPLVRTITVDNGTEFHSYAALERVIAARFYFATPHHAWERGTNENTNGLLRQYLPKRASMAQLTQHDCNRIAAKLNARPRKRLDYRTPEECYVP